MAGGEPLAPWWLRPYLSEETQHRRAREGGPCPECAATLEGNGLILWCPQGHVWAILRERRLQAAEACDEPHGEAPTLGRAGEAGDG
jgi:hypothetical protein